MNSSNARWRPYIAQHLDKLIACGLADYGPDPNAMWIASADIHTGRYPVDDTRPAHIGQRVYRQIDAPRGSTLYWDQPQLVAAYNLSQITGQPLYAEASDFYIRDFLARSVATNGLFIWGNHYFYHIERGENVQFNGNDEHLYALGEHAHDPYLHEIRPIGPAWDIFWRRDPEATERCIRAIAAGHLFDARIGGFNRHADRKRNYDFLEAGGVLAETFAWLYRQTGAGDLAELALKVARYSFDSRHPITGLLENARDSQRWDKITTTTEVGLWAGSLLRAADYTSNPSFEAMASDAVRAYLNYGFDEETGRYYGRLNVADGSPQVGEKETLYQPGTYANIWNALFPTHDYPLALAEVCVSLYARTHQPVFAETVKRWACIIEAERHAQPIRYAEHYGRAIHFLQRAAAVLNDDSYHTLAISLTEQAIDDLFAAGMFRGHTGEDRYDAVDGVGYLLLALMMLDTGTEPDLMGLGF